MPTLIELAPEDVRRRRELAYHKVASCGGVGASRQQDGSSPEVSRLGYWAYKKEQQRCNQKR